MSLWIWVSWVGKKHITMDMCCSGGGTDITRNTTITRDICVSQVGKNVSQGICVFQIGEHISLGVCVSEVGEHIYHQGYVFLK